MNRVRGPILILAGLGLAVLAWLSFGQYLKLETFLDNRETIAALVQRQWPLAITAYMAIYVCVVVSSLPFATLMTLFGGLLFGSIAGCLATVVAATIGATLVFIAAQTLLNTYFRKKSGPWLSRIRSEFQADAASYLMLVRLTPVFPFVIVNIAAALLGSRLSTFVWTTFVGIVPGTLAYSLVGSGLGDVMDRKAGMLQACRATGAQDCAVRLDFAALLSREFMLGLAALALLVLISIIVRRWRGGPAAKPPL